MSVRLYLFWCGWGREVSEGRIGCWCHLLPLWRHLWRGWLSEQVRRSVMTHEPDARVVGCWCATSSSSVTCDTMVHCDVM